MISRMALSCTSSDIQGAEPLNLLQVSRIGLTGVAGVICPAAGCSTRYRFSSRVLAGEGTRDRHWSPSRGGGAGMRCGSIAVPSISTTMGNVEPNLRQSSGVK
jgi:hypothetical protein